MPRQAQDKCKETLKQEALSAGKVYGGGQILQPETITDVLAKQQTEDKHFTVISHGDGAAVDLAAWKAGELDASSPNTFPKRRGVVFDIAGDDTVKVLCMGVS